MEAKINIAEILKDKPQGIRLYSPIFGKCCLKNIRKNCKFPINIEVGTARVVYSFTSDGKYSVSCDDGEILLFPSKEMQNWSKFTWKRGDVLIRTNSEFCIGIFDEWTSDDYSTFSAKYINLGLSDYFSCCYTCKTEEWEKTENSKIYISTIERVMNGKLNLQTLKIQTHSEFKDGDIVYAERDGFHYPSIHILKINGDTKRYYARLVINGSYDEAIDYDISAFDDDDPNRLRLATEEEKQQLFSALAKEGKAWDSEKKQIVDLKPKFELKPFDKVLCRDYVGKEWHIDLFESMQTDNSKYNYKCMANIWKICIPYEGNEHLLDTTKDVEE